MLKNILIILSLSVLAISCTRFDSNKLNRDLLQGEWIQVELIYFISEDSLQVEYPEGGTTLSFRGDSCVEGVPDQNKERYYDFAIKDYYLSMVEKGLPPSYLEIKKLTNDSLVLQADRQVWKYKKKAE